MSNLFRWRSRAPGGVIPLVFFTMCLTWSSAFSQEGPDVLARSRYLLVDQPPLIPREMAYSLEAGTMWEKQALYSGGAIIGRSFGKCFSFLGSSCIQYFDAMFSAGGRDGESHAIFLISPRWEWVRLPESYAPFLRIFGGVSHLRRSPDEIWFPAYGAGVGVTSFLHDRVDLRIESRIGYAQSVFGALVLGFEIKADQLLTDLAKQLGEFGIVTVRGAYRATTKALEVTKDGLGVVVDQATSPFRDKDSNAPDAKPPESPAPPAPKE